MALPRSALTTVARLRAWLTQGVTADSGGRLSDEALEGLISRASAAIAAWCDRELIAPLADRVYRFDGDGRRRLVLPDWPIAALTRVTVDGADVPARPAVGAAGHVARSAEAWIDLDGYAFTEGLANVEVAARLGYDPALATGDPRHQRALDDLEQACLLLAAVWFSDPFTRQPPESWPAEVRGLLAPYRRLGG